MNVRHNILSRFLGVLTVMVFALLGITSCSETETTDKTDFILYYTSMTDIGPGMSSDIAQPSYKGPLLLTSLSQELLWTDKLILATCSRLILLAELYTLKAMKQPQ